MNTTQHIFGVGVAVEASKFCRLAGFKAEKVFSSFAQQFITLCYILYIKIKKVIHDGCNQTVTESVTDLKKAKFSYNSVTFSYNSVTTQLQLNILKYIVFAKFVTEVTKKQQVAENF